ncbi:sensor histidine kinase [Bacteroides ovatus]|uniref:sensor histidine kinase n=2 Tax=Bacteroides ovatus TaxID=28116 RepID=UPI001E642BC1|nr:histidine kinase [Bacteroides ovatus]MDC2654304.1 histidine kinase [Bacteroides ovatus]
MSCLVGFMLTAMVGAICFLGQYYVIPEQMQRLNSDLPFFLLINALALILYFLAFSFTIFLHRWVAYQQRLNELENISIQTDLNHLKDQLQPEFFSRILNKVRTLLGEDGEKASLLIFKLSRLLRYQLYESERQQVLLGDDIDFMTDYMKLEKLCNPEFNFEVNILNEVRYIQVPPLLFMPVIEYVIRTTVCGENGKGENIRIDFQMEENQLRFICTYCLRKKESLQVAPAFDKLRQRLDLLYPGGYQLKSGYNDEALCTIGLMLDL